jgi:hypothetical protein
MKDTLEDLAVVLVILLFLFGPITVICACVGKIPLGILNSILPQSLQKIEDIPLKGKTRVLVAVVGVVVWIVVWGRIAGIAYFMLRSEFPNLPISPAPPTPTPTSTPTPTPTPTSPPTLTPTPTSTPTLTLTPTPTLTPAPTPTFTPTPFGSSTPTRITIVVDDLDSGFTRHGTEQHWKSSNIGYNKHIFRTLRDDFGDNWAQWCPQLPISGLYAVYAFIPRDNATTERAIYTIRHRGGETEVIIDQHKLYDEWIELGQFVFDAGDSQQCVILTDKTDEIGLKRRIGFDAIKWIFLGER